MRITLVVAAADNNAIGKNNQLLWHLPDDMRFFKNTTWAMPVIMGRKTFESMGKPLQGRTNIVVSRNPGWQADGVVTAPSLHDALQQAEKLQTREVFIIGGGNIYAQAMPLASRIYLTRVHTNPDGDTFFPALDEAHWKQVMQKDHPKDEKHAFDFSFECWERRGD